MNAGYLTSWNFIQLLLILRIKSESKADKKKYMDILLEKQA